MNSAIPPRVLRIARALLLLTTLVLGVTAALQLQTSPFGSAPLLDEESYLRWAHEIRAGQSRGVFYQDPLYPYLLAGVAAVLGDGFLVPRLLNVLFTLGAVLLTERLGRRVLGPIQGLVAAGLVALYGPLYLDTASIGKEPLLLLVATAACVFAVRAAERPRWLEWGLFGIFLGTLTLMRGNFFLLLPAVGIWGLWVLRGEPLPSRLGKLAVTCGAVLLPILPVAIHNYRASGELIPTTYGAGSTFFIGNNPRANGTYAPPPFIRPSPLFEGEDFTHEAERRVGRALKPAEVSRFWLAEGLRFWREMPAAALALLGSKLGILLHGHEVPGNYSFLCMRTYFLPVLNLTFVSFGILLPASVVGAWLVHRRSRLTGVPSRPVLVFLLGWAVLYGGACALFFVLGRYRVPLVPVLGVFASQFVVQSVNWVRERAGRSLASASVVFGAGLVLTHLPTEWTRNRSQELAQCTSLAGVSLDDQGRSEEGIPLLEQAVQLAPGSPEYLYNLGVALQHSGALDRAELRYREAISRSPSHAQAHANLGMVLLARERLPDALGEFARARELGLSSPQLDGAEATALFRTGRLEAARALVEHALSVDPASVSLTNLKLRVLLTQQDCEGARKAARRLLELSTRIEDELAREVADCPSNPGR